MSLIRKFSSRLPLTELPWRTKDTLDKSLNLSMLINQPSVKLQLHNQYEKMIKAILELRFFIFLTSKTSY